MLRSGYIRTQKTTACGSRGTEWPRRSCGDKWRHDAGSGRWLLCNAPVAALCALAVSAVGPDPSEWLPPQSGPVSPNPATGTPALAPTGRRSSRSGSSWRAAESCIAVGSFTRSARAARPSPGTTSSASARPRRTRSRPGQPSANGTVNSIQLTSDCQPRLYRREILKGGRFCRATISRISGRITTPWSRTGGTAANGRWTRSCGPRNNHLLVGGQFTSINGSRQEVLREPEPVHRQGRRLPEPEHLRALRVPGLGRQQHRGLQPATVARTTATSSSRAPSPRSKATSGSRSSCSTWAATAT